MKRAISARKIKRVVSVIEAAAIHDSVLQALVANLDAVFYESEGDIPLQIERQPLEEVDFPPRDVRLGA